MTEVLSASEPGMSAGGLSGLSSNDRRLTVLQVLPRLETGGVERGAVEIAQAIVAAGGRALVASAGGRLTSQLEQIGAEPVILPLSSKNPLTIYANADPLAKLIEREQVDIVHARSRAPAWSAKWAAQRTGRPFITTYHGVYTENLPLKRRYNSVMASGDMVIAISNYIADLVAQRHGVPRERIVTIPRGADLDLFQEELVTPARVMNVAHSWGVADDARPLILMPGRLTRWKGQELFVRAMEILRNHLGENAFHGVIVGAEDKGGRFEAELRRMIKEKGLERSVKIVGHCDDMPAAFKLSATAVSASLEPEAFGRVAVEAQAMGAPVIAAAHGGAMETVLDGETGYLFEPGSADALALALAEILNMPPAFRDLMREAAVRHVRRNFTVERMQAATISVYEAVGGRSMKPLF